MKAVIKYSIPLALCLLLLGCANEKKEWAKARKVDSITAYEGFMNRFKKSALGDSAKVHLERLYFAQAESTQTIKVYEDFIKRYPTGPNSEKIRKILGTIPKITNLTIQSTDIEFCRIKLTLSVFHKAGTIQKESIKAVLEFGGIKWPLELKIVKTITKNENNSVLNLETWLASIYYAGKANIKVQLVEGGKILDTAGKDIVY